MGIIVEPNTNNAGTSSPVLATGQLLQLPCLLNGLLPLSKQVGLFAVQATKLGGDHPTVNKTLCHRAIIRTMLQQLWQSGAALWGAYAGITLVLQATAFICSPVTVSN